jgi:hypothetical protein
MTALMQVLGLDLMPRTTYALQDEVTARLARALELKEADEPHAAA